jgi:transposase
VLDRWHLLKNVGEAVDAVLRRYRPYLLKSTLPADMNNTVTLTNLSGKPSAKEKKRQKNESKRRTRYERIQHLQQQGIELSAIAEELGISSKLTKKLLTAQACPVRKRPAVREGIIAPFLGELTIRFEAGCHNTMQLWRELTQLGFAGSYATVHKVVCRLQQGLPAQRTAASSQIPQKQRYTVRQAKWLFTAQPDDLAEEDAAALKVMLEHGDLAKLHQLTQDFSGMLRSQLADHLDVWLLQAKTSIFPAFRRLSRSLQREYTAFKAAIVLPWSSGQVEGQVQRLKLIKREMYGRANFDLLRQRVLLTR